MLNINAIWSGSIKSYLNRSISKNLSELFKHNNNRIIKCMCVSMPINDSNILLLLLRKSCNILKRWKPGLFDAKSVSFHNSISMFLRFLCMTQDGSGCVMPSYCAFIGDLMAICYDCTPFLICYFIMLSWSHQQFVSFHGILVADELICHNFWTNYAIFRKSARYH